MYLLLWKHFTATVLRDGAISTCRYLPSVTWSCAWLVRNRYLVYMHISLCMQSFLGLHEWLCHMDIQLIIEFFNYYNNRFLCKHEEAASYRYIVIHHLYISIFRYLTSICVPSNSYI